MTSAVSVLTGRQQFERALAFELRTLERIADSVSEVEGGWAVRTPSLPQVWSLNQLRLTRPIPPEQALELVDQHLKSLAYRQLVIEHDRADHPLIDPLVQNGFATEREVVMALDQSAARMDPRGPRARPRPGNSTPAVIEADEEQMLEIMERWVRQIHANNPTEVILQLVESARREGRAWREQRLGIAGDDGKLKAITKLRSDGHTAQVEDVYTAPEARRRGYARALVTHAVRLAQQSGNTVIFIVADDQDRPKQLYARIGFRPVGFHLMFHRELA